jgi:twitching motility two-component system response regulator PilH
LSLGTGTSLTVATQPNSCTLQATLSTQGVIQRLPNRQKQRTAEAQQDRREESNRAKILVVDDSPTQLTNLVKIVQGEGHEVITATNGMEGIEKAREEKPDLILMDVVMPELNGFQATRKITRDPATEQIPVILVTTKDQETDKVWGQRQGAAGYIIKPPKEAELIAKINEVLG